MDEADFDDLLEQYLDGTLAFNMEMANVEVVWVEGNPALGALHIAGHGVTKDEVEEALFQCPPEVEAKQHPDYPGRTVFWGMTREGRWLFISCDDWEEGGTRFLRPITAFTPDEGRAYWDQL
jgi:hypothetical protein